MSLLGMEWSTRWRPADDPPENGRTVLAAFGLNDGSFCYAVVRRHVEQGLVVWCDDATESEMDEAPDYWAFIFKPRL
jgi:hypothetical protein